MTEGNQARAAAIWRIEPLTETHARDILTWRYEYPYDFYDPPADANTETYIREFLRPELGFHSLVGRRGEFIGFCSFGVDGQVPGGSYQSEALDIGLGMRPDLTGHGLGETFFGAILDYAMETRPAPRYRLTVADFNERALRLYRRFGFETVDRFLEPRTGVAYSILVRQD